MSTRMGSDPAHATATSTATLGPAAGVGVDSPAPEPEARETVAMTSPAEPGGGWAEVLYASVWLVFLVFPLAAVLSSPASAAVKLMGVGGLALFAALYVISWIREIVFPRHGALVNALTWCGILLLPLALVAPSAGLGTLYAAPFFVAVCVFRLSLRAGFVTAAVIAALALGPWLVALDSAEWGWFLLGMTPAWLLLLVSRVVMDRSKAQEALQRELSLARQREAVGRDVHDILGHSLTVISVKVQLAKRLMDADPERASHELDDVLALTRDCLTDVRATVGKLREPELSAQLIQARAALRSAGITPHLPGTVPAIPDDRRATFAWILREATTNAVRHSRASTCTVTLTPSSLTITDDGVGLGGEADGAASSNGNGLHGMRERAGAAGLRLTVTSPVQDIGRGTRIVVEPV